MALRHALIPKEDRGCEHQGFRSPPSYPVSCLAAYAASRSANDNPPEHITTGGAESAAAAAAAPVGVVELGTQVREASSTEMVRSLGAECAKGV